MVIVINIVALMRRFHPMRASKVLGLFVVFALALTVIAADKDSSASSSASPSGSEQTLKGTIACAKCTFKVEKDCNIAIQVKEKDKDVLYYFDTESHKKWMGGGGDINFCTKKMDGTVTGTVSEKDGKKWVHVNKLEVNK
jgi:hypothetical protein